MNAFTKILVPFDGSEHAGRALASAANLAALGGAKLTLLHVVDLNKKISSLEQVSTGGYIPAELKEEGYKLLAEALHSLPKEISADTCVEIGAPPMVIVDVCKGGGYDLVIMGSRGLGRLQEFLVGSVSRYVVNAAPCPVMVVR